MSPTMLDTTKATAPSAAAHYLREAIAAIDEEFGDGYAAAHPELIGMLVQASAIESAVNAGRIASRETCETLLKLKPRLFG
ncbi:MAG: hypothetical protein AAFR57_12575 [Pseudomonadota bacterium]